MNITFRIIILNVLLTVVLVAMIVVKQWTLNTGTMILLETKPIDPRSLFRGDYVRLNYTINQLNLDEIAGDAHFQKNDNVFVVLQEDKPHWKPLSIHGRRPALKPGQVAIKGELISVQDIHEDSSKKPSAILHVRYGIENYFVPEGEGRALERPKDNEKIDMRIAVDKFGNAGIKAVLVNGKERYTETLF